MSRLKEKTTATLLIAVFMISIFAVAFPVIAQDEASSSLIFIGSLYGGIPVPPLPPIVDNLTIIPAEVELGETVTISVDVRNIDNQSYVYTISIRIGNFTHYAGAETGPYETVTVSRTYRTEVVGTRNVTVDGLTGSYKVNPLPPPPPPPPPFPVTNETDVVIIVTDPIEELNIKIDIIDAQLVILQDNIEQAFYIIRDMVAELLDGGVEMDSRIDVLETHSNEVNEQIESLENRISRIQTNILYANIATVITVILCAFLVAHRLRLMRG